MEIKIAHLYYDLMNLYGENGNIKALKTQLEAQDVSVKLSLLTIDDELDFKEYDIVYIGAGTEENQKLVLKHLLKYKEEIEIAIHQNKLFLITGNAIELFGRYILTADKKKIKALNIFPYFAKQENFRIADEALFQCDLVKEPVLGFQNQNSVMRENKNLLFHVLKGTGSYPNSKKEGIHEYEFYGTYLIGPLLVRNPELLKYFVKKIILSKDPNFKLKNFSLQLEKKAHDTFMENYYKEFIEEKKTSK